MADQENLDWIVTELRRAAAGERAPMRLREEIDAMSRRRAARPAAARSRRLVLLPVAGMIVALVVVLALVLPGGVGGPTVAQAALASTRGGWWSSYPSTSSISTNTRHRPGEYASFAAVRLPRGLNGHGAWTYAGERTETVDGRRIYELLYVHGTQGLVYSIAAKPLLADQKASFTSFTVSGRTVVSWIESGHSCLLVSEGASSATLMRLAQS